MTASKNVNAGTHSDIYELIWFRLAMMIDTVVLYILILGLEGKKISATIISQSFPSVWIEFCILLRHVSVINLVLILFHPFSIQEREPCLCDYIQ